jgi:hypothetical protein
VGRSRFKEGSLFGDTPLIEPDLKPQPIIAP